MEEEEEEEEGGLVNKIIEMVAVFLSSVNACSFVTQNIQTALSLGISEIKIGKIETI